MKALTNGSTGGPRKTLDTRNPTQDVQPVPANSLEQRVSPAATAAGATHGAKADKVRSQGAGTPLRPGGIASDPISSLAGNAANVAAIRLLRLESDLRRLRDSGSIGFFVANETRQLTQSQQTFVIGLDRHGRTCVTAVSALVSVDRTAPLIVWVEALLAHIEREHGLQAVREFNAGEIELMPGIRQPAYPLPFMLWLPFRNLQGEVIGGAVQAKTGPWPEAELVVSKHIADACAHAYLALNSRVRPTGLGFNIKARHTAYAAIAAVAIGCVPVSMSAIAPVEVAPRSAFVVTAPVDGVIDAVLVDPNSAVKKGQPIVRFVDTVLRNRLEVSEREVQVAEAKFKKASQLAFVDTRGRHELGIAQAELELRRSERDFAMDLLDKSLIRAERDGIAFFADAKDLKGRPVSVGERLMELADPNATEFRIDLPVSDAIVLRDRARVKVFLDASPLAPVEATLVRADFQAKLRENQTLAFRLIAQANGSQASGTRLGVRGTAQVYSDRVSLAFYLFRRPISAARQWFGI